MGNRAATIAILTLGIIIIMTTNKTNNSPTNIELTQRTADEKKFNDSILKNLVFIKKGSVEDYELVQEPMDLATLKALSAAYVRPGTKQMRRLLPRQITGLFSRIYGWYRSRKNREQTQTQINHFLQPFGYTYNATTKKYDEKDPAKVVIARAFSVDPNEWVIPDEGFESFNDFFTKTLKFDHGARPIAPGENILASPADGKVLVIQNVSSDPKKKASFFKVKSNDFTVKKFLNNDKLAAQYEGGTLIIIRLSPYNYHRYHFPIDCKPGIPQIISGGYESVDPIAYKKNIMPLTINVRHVIELSTKFGNCIMVVVGAFNVGSIVENFAIKRSKSDKITKAVVENIFKSSTDTFELIDKEKTYAKGEEAGYFQYGGSTIVLLFKKDQITVNDYLVDHSEDGYETAVKVGEALASFNEVPLKNQ